MQQFSKVFTELSGIGTSSVRRCMRPDAPSLAISYARWAAALRDFARSNAIRSSQRITVYERVYLAVTWPEPPRFVKFR